MVCIFTTWSVFQVVASWARAPWKTCASVAVASPTPTGRSEILATRHALLAAPAVAVLLWSVVVVVSSLCLVVVLLLNSLCLMVAVVVVLLLLLRLLLLLLLLCFCWCYFCCCKTMDAMVKTLS